jgi:hypothetical protein
MHLARDCGVRTYGRTSVRNERKNKKYELSTTMSFEVFEKCEKMFVSSYKQYHAKILITFSNSQIRRSYQRDRDALDT